MVWTVNKLKTIITRRKCKYFAYKASAKNILPVRKLRITSSCNIESNSPTFNNYRRQRSYFYFTWQDTPNVGISINSLFQSVTVLFSCRAKYKSIIPSLVSCYVIGQNPLSAKVNALLSPGKTILNLTVLATIVGHINGRK